MVVVGCVVLGIGAFGLFIYSRPPVLIVTDAPFVYIYGQNRLRREIVRASAALFRLVLPVVVADGASDDIVFFAVTNASTRPYAVIFPLRYAGAASFFHIQAPEVPVIVLEGRHGQGASAPGADDFFRFRTDTETDLYRAGRLSAILNEETGGQSLVFLGGNLIGNERQIFQQALAGQGEWPETQFFYSIAELGSVLGISSAVLAGSGTEFLERRPNIPVIFFTWLNPAFMPGEVVVVFDDSPWVQAEPAVRMMAAGIKNGQIASRPLVLSARVADNDVLRRLRNAANSVESQPHS
ncbi:MAG: hypothetical protein FWG66_16445 [Spirochaetes bacterium]|nr:hypothetical protein [Spirochaetota bacterium]